MTPRWARVGLLAILVFDVWWRGHTFAPTIGAAVGVRAWPVVVGEAEPLDCDEAAYAYIGRRLVAGDVMYRDLTENKPPGGYWLYALAVGVAGANETAVRLLAIPLVLGTIALVWWLGLMLGGPVAACVGAFAYAIASTDPYLYGNGTQFEQAMNLFSTAALAGVLRAFRWEGNRLPWLAVAGAALGAACLVKQVAVLHGVVLAGAVVLGRGPARSRFRELGALGAGFGAVWAVALGVLGWRGALGAAFEDVVRYGGALAALPSEPNAPPGWMRWLTGNADPQGRLPPPFGGTQYLVWWGGGSWPFWLASGAAAVWMGLGRRAPAGGRLVAAWTLSAAAQVVAPGLYWPHYYLLPLPGLAVALGVGLAEAVRPPRRPGRVVVAVGLAAGLLGTAAIQVRSYLMVPAEELAVRYKGGGQWVFLRGLGRALRGLTDSWADPRLFVWGIQSPLYLYGGFDGVTAQVFADNLIRDRAARPDGLIGPRLDRMMRDLAERPPDLVFAGYPPFERLGRFLADRYEPATLSIRLHPESPPVRVGPFPGGMGLWVRRDRGGAFRAAAEARGP